MKPLYTTYIGENFNWEWGFYEVPDFQISNGLRLLDVLVFLEMFDDAADFSMLEIYEAEMLEIYEADESILHIPKEIYDKRFEND